jgi:hypothetical protein
MKLIISYISLSSTESLSKDLKECCLESKMGIIDPSYIYVISKNIQLADISVMVMIILHAHLHINDIFGLNIGRKGIYCIFDYALDYNLG